MQSSTPLQERKRPPSSSSSHRG